ncbi:MAG: NTP transferase domain-containing protein [Nanoarchaeota archaeon]|nr:NTP transferase domain-containing protein [Nanoarchaeota archaeon]
MEKKLKHFKGVILAGGNGTRLKPLTEITNKHLLPIYNKPMIDYAIETLINAKIKDILIICGKGNAGHFLDYLSSGEKYGVKINYIIQEEAGGIAQALSLAEHFVGINNVCVILGDNIFEDKINLFDFEGGSRVYLKEVKDPKRFGIANIKNNRIIEIIEKPKKPESNLAVSGLYVYDSNVFKYIKKINPSKRGELEITDVNNMYIQEKNMSYKKIKGFWLDAGTFESLFNASKEIRKIELKKK